MLGCSWREWIEAVVSASIYSPAQTPPGPPLMKDMVHTIRAVSSLN